MEQPLGKRWVLLGEWFSGRHDFGFAMPGAMFHPSKYQVIAAVWKIPTR